MSRVTDVYNQLVSIVGTTLSTYQRLPNAYELEENNELYLKKGYAVAFGPGENTGRVVSCRETIQREFPVALIRRITQTEHATTARADLEKAIMEDCFSLIDALESNPQMNGVAANAAYASDSGIQFLEGERSKYYLVELSVLIEYFDNI